MTRTDWNRYAAPESCGVTGRDNRRHHATWPIIGGRPFDKNLPDYPSMRVRTKIGIWRSVLVW